jgi:hypothetical protein
MAVANQATPVAQIRLRWWRRFVYAGGADLCQLVPLRNSLLLHLPYFSLYTSLDVYIL